MRVAKLLATAALALGLMAAGAIAGDRALKVVGPWEIGGIDPDQSGYVFSRLQVAETLVTAAPDGTLKPALAEAWSVSEDGLTWRFTIRAGAVFHDGLPVTAEAATASLKRARAGAGVLTQLPIEDIASDGQDVVIRLARPFAALPAFLVNYSTIILAPASYDASGAVWQVIGSGPYKVAGLTPPLKLELEAAPGWRGDKPGVERVSYLAVGQGETRALMAESGEADVVFSMLPVSVERLKRNSELDVRIATIPRTRLLKLNAASPFFDDVEERQAISLAIDRAGIARTILRNPELAASQLFPAALAGWHVGDLQPLTHDTEKAKALLAKAGWRSGSDGILEQDGTRFSVTLHTYANWPELPPIATAIQAQLREVGIDLKVSVGNSSEIVSRHRDGTLEMGLVSRLYSVVPDPIGTLLQDYGPEGGDWGAMGWSSPELIAVTEALVSANEDRAPLQRQAVEILQRELPGIPVTWSELAIVSNKRVIGVEVDPLEVNYRIGSIRWAEGVTE